jgi:hypothetical protein
MPLRARALTFGLLLIGAGCGGDENQPPEGPPPRELQQPLLRSVAPTAIRAGDQLTIFGANFADQQLGETRLTFEGVYQTSAGRMKQVNLEVVPTFNNQGVLTWQFGPNIPFTSEEDTGAFRGILKARNVGRDGQVKEATQALGVELQVLPSILIRQLRPASQSCGVGTSEVTDNTKIVMELKAIGLKSGTSIAPLRFGYTFMKESFQFNGYLSSKLGLDPEELFPQTGPVSIVDEVKNGTISTLGAGAPRNVYVQKGTLSAGMIGATSVENLFALTDLITAPLPDAQNSRKATLNVVAVDSTGQEARRSIQLTVWAPVEVRYDGGSEVVRTFDPVPVSGCIAGGPIGTDVTYTESSSETRQRGFNVNSKVGASVEPSVFGVSIGRLNAEFGFDVQSSVSSSTATSLAITAKILPREFAVFYRQTIQLERRARLIGHGVCGGTQDLGEVVVTDWTWSPDLAKGSACPPLPPSNLPKGQQFK